MARAGEAGAALRSYRAGHEARARTDEAHRASGGARAH